MTGGVADEEGLPPGASDSGSLSEMPLNDAGVDDAGTPFPLPGVDAGLSDGGGEAFVADHLSGSRLRAVVDRAEGGAELLKEWYDTKLDTSCQWVKGTDSRFRCLPKAYAFAYANAYCSRPAVAVNLGESPPKFGVIETDIAACRRPKVFRAGAQLASGYLKSTRSDGTTACETFSGYSVYDTTGEVDVSEFVGADGFRERRGALSVDVIRAYDGARHARLIVDASLGFRCFFSYFDDLISRPHLQCKPDMSCLTLRTNGDFTDPACLEPAAYRPSAGAQLLSRYIQEFCGEPIGVAIEAQQTTTRYRRVTGQLMSGIYRGVNGTCTAQPAQSSPRYSLGAEVRESEFVTFARKSNGTGRLTVDELSVPTGEPLRHDTSFADTKFLNAPCVPFLVGTKTRCVPIQWIAFQFADAACTLPAITSDSAAALVIRYPDTGVILAYKAVESNQTMFYGISQDMCVGRSIQLPPRTKLYVAGEQVPSTDFVEITEGRE